MRLMERRLKQAVWSYLMAAMHDDEPAMQEIARKEFPPFSDKDVSNQFGVWLTLIALVKEMVAATDDAHRTGIGQQLAVYDKHDIDRCYRCLKAAGQLETDKAPTMAELIEQHERRWDNNDRRRTPIHLPRPETWTAGTIPGDPRFGQAHGPYHPEHYGPLSRSVSCDPSPQGGRNDSQCGDRAGD